MYGGATAPTIPDVEYDDLEEMPVFNQMPPRLDSLCATTNFSRKEIKLLYQAFKAECPSGRMTVDEFSNIYNYFFPMCRSKEFVTRAFSVFDRNNDGIVKFEELILMLSDLWSGSLETKIDWAFDLMDHDRKGAVNFEEFLIYLRSVFDLIGYRPTSDRARLRHNSEIRYRAMEIFLNLDVDKDGVISRHDFMQSCSNSELVVSSMDCLREPMRGGLHRKLSRTTFFETP